MNLRSLFLPFLSRRAKIVLVAFIALLITGYVLLVTLFFSAPKNFPINEIVIIEEGETLNQISQEFKERNLIRSSFVFESLGWFFRIEKNVQAGEYFFEKKIGVSELIKQITGRGDNSHLVKITIPEGTNLQELGFIFENKGAWQAEELWEVAGFPATTDSLEGFLFPDTYFVPAGVSPQSLVEVMRETFEKKVVEGLADEIKNSNRSLLEIVTMASLIEKEAADEDDRALISGILWKRIDIGMLLQVDAVFPYIIGKNSFQLTKKDLKINSPYNTYLYKGLPAGPITNPGLDSIGAALNPEESPFWFYLSDKESRVHYSVTYEEHLAKKEKYLR